MVTANPRIHAICGVCGSNKDFTYRLSCNIDDNACENLTDEEYDILRRRNELPTKIDVHIVCDNCSTLTSLDEIIPIESEAE